MNNISYKSIATVSIQAALSRLESAESGLASAECAVRLQTYGTNKLKELRVSSINILLRQFKSAFIYLLIGAAVIALVSKGYTDATMVIIFIVINATIGFYQEYRAEQASRVLKKYWKNKASALRDGTFVSLDAADLVPGDIVELEAGDKIPADIRFTSALDCTVDESVLTGESVNVAKRADALASEPVDYYEAHNVGFSGTSLLTGKATALVFATGTQSSLGRIAALASETRTETAFEQQISRFSIFILKLIAITLVFVLVLNIGLKGWGNIEELLLFAIALTIGVVPEALPLVMTFSLSQSAMRMTQRHVIVRRLSAINDLGSIDVLCTDKTGTITENSMHVADISAHDKEMCLEYALLGSDFVEGKSNATNSFDTALWNFAGREKKRRVREATVLGEIPFDPIRKRNSVLISRHGRSNEIIVRGAPEDVLACSKNHGAHDEALHLKYVQNQGRLGRRTIAVAHTPAAHRSGITAADEKNLELVGFISFEDPLKEGTRMAVKKAHALGVQIKILTGDAKEVAGAVAHSLGLIQEPTHVITGAEFEKLPADAQLAAVRDYHVFARTNPEQKFRVLSLLESQSISTGFLGEGFNDAPALRKANVSIAVDNAADIAKDSADVILLKKSLTVIMDGIEEGRRTFANTTKYLNITLASNFGNFYAVSISSLFIPFLPMLPAQILLLNLVTDAPMISIAGDSVPIDELKKPARYSARNLILLTTIIGLVSSSFDFLTFALFRKLGEAPLQTLWFMESALTEIVLIYSLRTRGLFWKGARIPKSILILSVLVVATTLALPFTNIGKSFFHFVEPPLYLIAAVLGIVAIYFFVSELVKKWMYRVLPKA